jgi:hypothetical protein
MPDGLPACNHKAALSFWSHYHRLPMDIQLLADKNFKLLKANPRQPSLHFKKTGRAWSVRVGIHYRALSIEVPEGYLWFWIGHHDQYDQFLD